MTTPSELDFSNFTAKDIKKLKVVFDIIRGKLKISDIKKLYKMYTVVEKIQSGHNFKLSYLGDFKPKNILLLISIHNKYTTREKIDIETFVNLFVELIHRSETILEENPQIEHYLSSLLTLTSNLKGRGVLSNLLGLKF